MSVVFSGGELRLINLGDEARVTPARWVGPAGSQHRIATLADPATATYEAIYSSQRWVRTAVDFLARNVAQCRVHVYRRTDDDSRIRLTAEDHPYAAVLAQPDPSSQPPLTSFRFVHGLVADMVTFGNGWAVKRPDADSARQLLLTRAEAPYVLPSRTSDDPQLRLRYARPGYPAEWLDVGDVLWVRAWSPIGVEGVSWVEPLRQLLAEEFEASVYRSQLWRSGARMAGWIKRPVEAGDWSEQARERFRQDWRAMYSGLGSDAGGTPLLEDGMEYTAAVFSAEQAQFLQTRELDREEVASAMFIPPTMLGQTKGATYANTREHHAMLYQDTLGPLFADLEQEFQGQVLPDLDADNDGVYCEFNIAEKLQGSFEDQANAAKSAVGVPWMTPNEMRARFNLPRIESVAADALALPLNMTTGGVPEVAPGEAAPAAPAEEEPTPPEELAQAAARRALPAAKSSEAVLDAHRADLAEKLARFFRRQGASVGAALSAGQALAEAWDSDRWDGELADVLLRGTLPLASAAAQIILDLYASEDLEWSDDPFVPPLSHYAASSAKGINVSTYQQLVEAADDPDLIAAVFVAAMAVRAGQNAQTSATYAIGLGQSDAAKATGLRSKTWVVTSTNPRPTHAALSGETVAVASVFSNGMRWPGDQAAGLGAGEYANCTCRCSYSATEP